MRYAYYPGCSLESGSAAYDVSVRAICHKLGVQLDEIDDWNCCGATEYVTQDRLTASAVIARNLALVDQQHTKVMAPCAACYLNLKKTDLAMQEDGKFAGLINEALAAGKLGYRPGRVTVHHLLDLLYDDVGEAQLKRRVAQSLRGLRVAPYYGCQIVRPTETGDDPEYPMHMDQILGWLGAEVVDYPVKAHCCGGHMTQISEPQALELIRRLLQSAATYEADVICCVCPMCQLNLDLYQGRVNNYFNESFRVPIVYLSQLVGIALGIADADLGLGKEIVPASETIREKISSKRAAGAT